MTLALSAYHRSRNPDQLKGTLNKIGIKFTLHETGRKLDRAKAEDFKTRFYKFEGYNPDNGYPTRQSLDKMKLKKVADLLQSKNKLG